MPWCEQGGIGKRERMIYTVTLNPALDKTLLATGLEPETINRARVLRLDCGGKGINVSRALRNLGLPSVATGWIGGATGEHLARGLRQEGIQTDLIPIAGETRTNLTIHDQRRGVLVKLNEAGPTVSDEDVVGFLQHVQERAQPGDIWVLSGNLPPGAPDDLYATLIGIVQSAGGHAWLDASGAPLRLGCAAAPKLAKPNLSEAESVLGRSLLTPDHWGEALRAFLDMGIACVALSLGKDGAVIADGRAAHWARPPTVQAWSNIGAGDSLLAGLLWSATQGMPLAEAIRWAVAAGTAAVLEEGTGVCTRARTEALYAQVAVAPL